jgi:hypothetical protein
MRVRLNTGGGNGVPFRLGCIQKGHPRIVLTPAEFRKGNSENMAHPHSGTP